MTNGGGLNCPACNTAVAPGQAFCTGCGADLRMAAATAKCPKCATMAPTGARFCTGCGNDMHAPVDAPRDRKCPYCNDPVAASQAFCTGCGRSLPSSAPQRQPVTIAPAQPVAQVQQMQQQQMPPQGAPGDPPQRKSWVLPVFAFLMVVVVAICGFCAFSVYQTQNAVAGIINGFGSSGANEGQRAPTYGQILEIRKQKSGDDWTQYVKSLQGMQADNWSGKVYDVQPSIAGSAVLVVALDEPNGGEAHPNVNIPFVNGSKITLKKGDKVRFSGRISYAVELFGVLTFTMDNTTVRY